MHKDAIDFLVLHQANQRILDSAAQRLGVPSERVVSNLAGILPTRCYHRFVRAPHLCDALTPVSHHTCTASSADWGEGFCRP